MKNKILILLLGLLGFAGCDPDDNGDDILVMYGTPTARFTIKGRVTNTAGTPIRGILVTPVEAWSNTNPSEKEPIGVHPENKIYTGEDGTYKITTDSWPWSVIGVSIRMEDVDGEQNGGEFAPKTTEVLITKDELTDEGDWVSTFEKQIGDTQLEPAEKEN